FKNHEDVMAEIFTPPIGLRTEPNQANRREAWNFDIDSDGNLVFNSNSHSGVGGQSRMLLQDDSGFVGMGTKNPRTPLHIYSPVTGTSLRLQSSKGFGSTSLEFWSDPQGSATEWRPGFIQSIDEGNFTGGLAFYVNGSGPGRKQSIQEVMRLVNGNVYVEGDIIMKNADCAEEFTIEEAETIEPGTVMVIEREGQLRQSTKAYDKKVAGVISGAGDFKPGLILDRQSEQTNRLPIALMGKVYCKVDAQYGALEIGDLLTTSPTPGHAMKAEDPLRAFGAVIGKALRPLQEGMDLIPILVALQ
ncbi:MAG: hypothetical protein AAGA60_32100, partial [Cyanobacteria bacterium P01_E01_bin.42]